MREDAAKRADEIVNDIIGMVHGARYEFRQNELHADACKLIDAAAALARREERASIADWFEETFCPRAGVKGDETHARGDCDYCNMASAIRQPASAPEREK